MRHRVSRLVTVHGVAIALWAGTIGPGRGEAQTTVVTAIPPDTGASLVQRVDSLYRQGNHEESLALLEEQLEASPHDALAETLAAREALLLGIVVSYSSSDEAKAWYYRSVEHGERALAMDSLDDDARYFTLAARGRLALVEGPRERARLGVAVDSAARALLAQDSLHAGAHNALGRLYFEVASLSWVERVFARRWMGGELVARSTWTAAENHLRRAVELQPERNLYQVDLGALYVKRDRLEEARAVLQAALEVPLEIPGQELFRDDARRLLGEIQRRIGPAG